MTVPGKIQFAISSFHRFVVGISSIVNLSFAQTLEQERERLLRLAVDCLAQQSDADPGSLWAAAGDIRQKIETVLLCRAEQLSKDELIALQSALHSALDEQLRQAVQQWHNRRFKALLELARHDQLTGLMNRTAFDARLNEEFLRARRHARQLSLVMFDVDDFKLVNDRLGHPAGDRVLIAVAQALQSSFRQSDGVFRFGGDEFVVVCPETSASAIENVLLRLRQRLQTIGDEPGGVGLSWGIADLTADIAGGEQLVQLADERLYECKRRNHRQQHQRMAAAR